MWITNLRQRLLVGFLLFGLIILVLWQRGWVLGVGISLFALVCELEMLMALRLASFRPAIVPGVLLAVGMYPAFYWKGLEGLVALFTVLCAVIIVGSVVGRGRPFLDTAVSIFALVYPCWFFVFMILLSGLEQPLSTVALFVALVGPVATDVGAYFAGHFFGKRKLAPIISPKKTIEGAIGGLLITAGAMAAIGACIIVQGYFTNLALWHYPLMGIAVSVLAQAGDLMASGIKRFAGIKDFSNLLPGHGGFMDRMDSILFGGVAVYCYLQLFHF